MRSRGLEARPHRMGAQETAEPGAQPATSYTERLAGLFASEKKGVEGDA